MDGPSANAVSDQLGIPQDDQQPGQPPNPFEGMGPLLEDPDDVVFKTVDGLVLRQEIPALNHLAQDTHWTYVKMGYPWSTLEKDPNRSTYRQSLPYGSAAISVQAIPNKAWDLINKTTEALLVDFPQAEAEPGDSWQEATAACEMANRFLDQDASESGTNDAALFWDRVQNALTCASSYIEYWVDPTGGGYIPLQIPAHPHAVSPMNPLIGPDGLPTVDPILRYVTSVGPDGQPTAESQFTDDETQAAPQWQPKIRASKWQRAHIRVYPETATVDEAEKVIVLGHCTIGEGKRRWQSLAMMQPDELGQLCDWQPPRYIALLPWFLRGRWQLTDGRSKNKQGSSDERTFFYYHIYAKASPDHPKGADVVVTGALNKFVIDRQLLSAEVEVPVTPDQIQQPAPGASPASPASPAPQQGVVGSIAPQPTAPPSTRKETRCMEIPVVQITPRGDPDDQDPTGRSYIEMIAGAVENNAHLAMSASEVIDRNLHLEGYSRSTSPITGQMREDARATGDILPIITPDDMPKWGDPIPFDNAFFNFFEQSDLAINSIGSTERGATGADNSLERSGKAIQLATANNNVSLSGMNVAVNNAYTRASRIKIELAVAKFTTAQQINYVGDDGIFKQESWSAIDFALVGKITIKGGTGGLLNPAAKVQNLSALVQGQMLSPDEAKDAARAVFSRTLGLQSDPGEQRMERQIAAFNKGPPSPEWVQQWQQYQQQLQAYQEMQQNAQLAAQNAQMQGQHAAATTGAPPPPQKPVQTAMKPPVMPWTPFTPQPTDSSPVNAMMRARKLANLIDTAKFESWPPEWQGTATAEYSRMFEAVIYFNPLPPLPKGVTIRAMSDDPGSTAQQVLAALHPGSAPPPHPTPWVPFMPGQKGPSVQSGPPK